MSVTATLDDLFKFRGLVRYAPDCSCSKYTAHEIVLYVKANGAYGYRLECGSCGSVSVLDIMQFHLSPYELDNAAIYWISEQRHYPPCVRCGEPGVDAHHWAPRALFPDADFWPVSHLCRRCHEYWHAVMRTPNAPLLSACPPPPGEIDLHA